MATIFIYAPLRAVQETFTTNQLKATQLAFNISFIQRYCAVGEFSFSVPATDGACPYLAEDNQICIDGRYWGIIRDVKQEGDSVTVTGDDMKGILAHRITLYPEQTAESGLQGYDAIRDVSTEALVKYFVTGNAVSPSDPNRAIAHLEIATDQGRGEQNDAYMSRFEPLADLLKKNLELRKMGWAVAVDLARGKYVFDVTQGIDRSGAQYDNPRVVFDVALGNVLSLEYVRTSRAARNVFYASLSSARSTAQTLTCMYTRDEAIIPIGIDRREQHLNVSVAMEITDLYTQLKDYALKDAEQYKGTETMTVQDAGRYIYGVDYNLGDTVTIQARGGVAESIAGDAQVTGVTTAWLASGGVGREITLGDARVYKWDAVRRQMKNEGE